MRLDTVPLILDILGTFEQCTNHLNDNPILVSYVSQYIQNGVFYFSDIMKHTEIDTIVYQGFIIIAFFFLD